MHFRPEMETEIEDICVSCHGEMDFAGPYPKCIRECWDVSPIETEAIPSLFELLGDEFATELRAEIISDWSVEMIIDTDDKFGGIFRIEYRIEQETFGREFPGIYWVFATVSDEFGNSSEITGSVINGKLLV